MKAGAARAVLLSAHALEHAHELNGITEAMEYLELKMIIVVNTTPMQDSVLPHYFECVDGGASVFLSLTCVCPAM